MNASTYCPFCKKEHKLTEQKREVSIIVEKTLLTETETSFFCEETHKTFLTSETMNAILYQMRKDYRKTLERKDTK